MRTIFTAEDVKNIVENIFNGNLMQSRASGGSIPYENANSEKILFVDDESGTQEEKDIAEYLNIKFYNWKERLISNEERALNGEHISIFDTWVQSLNFSMNEAYALVEKIDEEVTASQDIDSSVITGKVTFIIQTNKIKNLDYYISKIRNAYLGNPQDIQNSYGDIIKAYIMMGALSYDQEPFMSQLGETIIVSSNFRISYLNNALSYNDTEIEISLDGDDVYNDLTGEIVGSTNYLKMPLTKMTWQNVFASRAIPTAERPDLTGYIATSLSNVKTLSFYDFNKELTMKFNDLFWRCNCYRYDGVISIKQDVNIPVFIRITSNGHYYVFKDMIDEMQKVITNNDFNISSITLKGWGKIE